MSDKESEKPLKERCRYYAINRIKDLPENQDFRPEANLNIQWVIDNGGLSVGYMLRQEFPAEPTPFTEQRWIYKATSFVPLSDIGHKIDPYLDPDCRIRWTIVSKPDKSPPGLEWRKLLGDEQYGLILRKYEQRGLLPCAYNSEGVTEWRRPLTDDEFYALAENLGIVEKLENQKL